MKNKFYWKNVSDEEIISIARQMGYDKLSRSELHKKDQRYYNQCLERKLLDDIIPSKKPSEKELSRLYDKHKSIYKVAKELEVSSSTVPHTATELHYLWHIPS